MKNVLYSMLLEMVGDSWKVFTLGAMVFTICIHFPELVERFIIYIELETPQDWGDLIISTVFSYFIWKVLNYLLML